MTDTCPACAIEREYDRTAPMPEGYALVYACPVCGSEARHETEMDDRTDPEW